MELKITDGEYTLGDYLAPTELEEFDEVLQRVTMKLKVRRGSFLPLPDYGSRLYLLSKSKPSSRETAARQYVLEALADETELELSALELSQKDDGEAALSLTFIYKSEYTVNIETEI